MTLVTDASPSNRYVERKVEFKQGSYLEDGKRRADYAIILENSPEEPLTTYISTLRKLGLELETFEGTEVEKIFLLVHIPQKTIDRFCDIFNFRQEKRINLPQVVRTPLMGFTRAISQIPVEQSDEFTSASRIVLINKILSDASFGPKLNDFGLAKLKHKNAIKDAYPLHDGPSEWNEVQSNPNDRQLLLKSWANFSQWYKEVPLDLVQKYFGCEIAFYYAWLEFFAFMLVPAALLGLIVFITSLILVSASTILTVEDVCGQDNLYFCPTCELEKGCKYRAMSTYCTYAKWNYVFDNYLTIFFAVFMSFWSTLFVKLWKRKENRLRLRWNIHTEESKFDESQIYAERTKRTRMSKFTGKLELYVPSYINILYITCTMSAIFLLLLVVVIAIFAVVFYKTTIPNLIGAEHGNYFTIASSSLIQVVIIKLFERPIGTVSKWLTTLENPRTQFEFDSSVLHKMFLLSFANNYAVLFYIAFVKGHLFTKPRRHVFQKAYEKDTCQPFGCIVPLCVQLAFLMVLKNFARNIISALVVVLERPALNLFSRLLQRERRGDHTVNDTPQFEEDHKLKPTDRYLIMRDFSLANNVLEHRLGAVRLVTELRRPLPRIVRGIGDWDGILLGVTYLSMATNAFVLAFTSDFVGREVYKISHSTLRGYVNSSLSRFSTKGYDANVQMNPHLDLCYYKSYRYPPDHPEKYALSDDYWQNLTWRLLYLNIDRRITKEAKFKLFSNEIKGKRGTAKINLTEEDFTTPHVGEKNATEDEDFLAV
ncbi:hypothetical protein NQ318_013583 [Aromia moschata]|uniref:Anoctamin n=1 Tax=Aromia moschata TaxID=1265417 RepID=A0AAV8YDE6_9CUCU|nr:hypothetical protein NQ318_013583 [Aromia moschata]